MSLTKTISAIFTTIGIAIPSALTTWVLTKPKPLKEIDKTIELDEYEEEIEEKEIKPQEAPPSSVPPRTPIPPSSIPDKSPPLVLQGLDDQLTEEASPSGGGEEPEQAPTLEEQADPITPNPPEPPKEEKPEEPEEKDPEKTDDEQEEESEKEEDVEEIKKSLVEAIGVIIQKYKDGYRIETGGIYDSFDMKQKLEYLVQSIKFLEKDKKEKEEAAKERQKAEGSDGKSSKEATEGESQ